MRSKNGKTFEENATAKALVASQKVDGLVVADDSGLEVDALGGAPGIFSARYAGEDATDVQNVEKLLARIGARSVRNVATRAFSLRARARARRRIDRHTSRARSKETSRKNRAAGMVLATIRYLCRRFDHTFAEMPAELKNQLAIARARGREALARTSAANCSRIGLNDSSASVRAAALIW